MIIEASYLVEVGAIFYTVVVLELISGLELLRDFIKENLPRVFKRYFNPIGQDFVSFLIEVSLLFSLGGSIVFNLIKDVLLNLDSMQLFIIVLLSLIPMWIFYWNKKEPKKLRDNLVKWPFK